jgi:hypothetical protein
MLHHAVRYMGKKNVEKKSVAFIFCIEPYSLEEKVLKCSRLFWLINNEAEMELYEIVFKVLLF